MKCIIAVLLSLFQLVNANSQGITLLYTSNGWVQIDTLPGQTPANRPPTYLDDVVFSATRSGLSSYSFVTSSYTDSFSIGGGPSSYCHRMYVYGMEIEFLISSLGDYGANVYVHTLTGGGFVLDSGAVLQWGQLYLYGENPGVNALEVRDSKFGEHTQHNTVQTQVFFEDGGRALFKRSSFAGFYFGSADRHDGTYATGGGLYADSSTFNAGNFILGNNSVDTFLNSSIRPIFINDGGLKFLIGKNSNFISANDTIFVHYGLLDFTTSGSVFNGNVQGWYVNFSQQDSANALPNIINGDLIITEDQRSGISGDLKISGNLTAYMPGYFYLDSAQVVVNGSVAFAIAGITNFGKDLIIDSCVQDFCHYKLEFFGNTNSNISWNIGFPVDTLVINKTGCAKVTSKNSLYVAGSTLIEGGQLVLEPNGGVPYMFVSAGNVDIAQGAGLFLKKDSIGNVANMAIAGTITDHNTIQDSICSGFSNPYGAAVDIYGQVLPVTLTDFSGKYQNKAVALSWKTEKEFNTKYFSIEKSFDLLTFTPMTRIPPRGSAQQAGSYSYLDKDVLRNVNYYRLKVVDVDEHFTYSKTITVTLPGNFYMSLFPNPVKNQLLIRIQDLPGKINAMIVDGKGSVVKKITFNGWSRELVINTEGLPTGVYSLMLSSATLNKTLRFLKE